MCKIAGLLLLSAGLFFGQKASELPYCEDVVPAQSFNAQGTWTLTGVSGFAEVNHLSSKQRKRLIGTNLVIDGKRATFWNKKAMSWKEPFPTPVIGEESYDTQSREFWLDFRTDPKELSLPRYVAIVDVELGDVLLAGANRVLFDYQGRVVRYQPGRSLKSTIVASMLRLFAALLAGTLLLPAQDWSLDHLFTRPFVWGTWPSQISWAKHAHILGFLWNAKGETFKDLYVYDADSKKLTRLTDLESLKDPINETEAERDEHRKDYLVPPAGLNSFDLSEDGAKAVFSYHGDLFLVHTNGGPILRITKTKAAEVNPQFSPDGTKVAFTQAGQIYVLNLGGGTLEQRTDVRPPAALTSFRWSPDGKYFSYSVQPQPGRTMPLPIYSGQFVSASTFPRTVAGDTPTPSQQYVIESTGDNPPRLLETGRGFGFRPPQWSEDSKYLVLVTEATNYKSEDIRIIDVNTGKSKVVFHQTDDRWIEASDVGWDPASKHIWFTSDQSGFQHLYAVGLDGGDAKQITKGSWEIHNDPFSHSPQWIGDYIYYSSTANGTTRAPTRSREGRRFSRAGAHLEIRRIEYRLAFSRRKGAGDHAIRHEEPVRSVRERRAGDQVSASGVLQHQVGRRAFFHVPFAQGSQARFCSIASSA